MCGIYCTLSRTGFSSPKSTIVQYLGNRGPDSRQEHRVKVQDNLSDDCIYISFLSTVLSLRGSSIVCQPLVDGRYGSMFCWNGEAWRIGHGPPIAGSDSKAIFDLLLQASSSRYQGAESINANVLETLALVRGPYAFVYFDAIDKIIYYGRDCLGRRSLLRKTTAAGDIVLSSICDGSAGDAWSEVEADGVYVIKLFSTKADSKLGKTAQSAKGLRATHIKYGYQEQSMSTSLTLPYPPLNRTVSVPTSMRLTLNSNSVHTLESRLRDSLSLRVRNIRQSSASSTVNSDSMPAQVGILFSGGLDCTVLARISHDLIPLAEPIDLLNVAFENPRIHKDKVSPYDLCPDRITGVASYTELQRVCPGRRWRFVRIDVPYTETFAHRQTVISLIHPHNTEMDLSIAYALYFASRGSGKIVDVNSEEAASYTTPARVLLSGLGADELFGGYQRHASAFERNGYQGLIDELELDINRLGKRNLGRDDRVIANWGREARFPYLDEDLLGWALDAPVWEKTGFGQERIPMGDEKDESESGGEQNANDDLNPPLEPGKKVLRLLAWRLGMRDVAKEKKRAIQFGARTAKMEVSRTKGTQLLS